MIIAKLFFPGLFVDAYIYLGRLIAFTDEQSMRMYDLEGVAASIERDASQYAPAAIFLFARNDWLRSAQITSLMRNTESRDAFLSLVRRFSELECRVIDSPARSEAPFRAASQTILDMECYGYRLYVGANDGLYDVPIDWTDWMMAGQPHKRLDARCQRVAVGFGSVNVSCGADGLFAGLDEFSQSSHPIERGLNRVSDVSLRTSWFGNDLLNYEDNVAAELFQVHTEKVDRRRADRVTDSSIITYIETDPIPADSVFGFLSSEYRVNEEDVQYSFNTSKLMFVHTYAGQLYSLDPGLDRSSKHVAFGEAKLVNQFDGPGERILSASPWRLGGGCIVFETDNRVQLFYEGKMATLVEEPVISVRVYNRTKRAQNLLTAVAGDGIWVMAVLDESKLT